MKILSVQVKNFRCMRDDLVEFSDLTILLGKNGAGKSTILKALDVFYDVAYSAEKEDFFDRNTDKPIIIAVTYSNLNKDELKEFNSYLVDNKLTVQKVFDREGIGKYYGASMQIPQFADIRNIDGKMDKRKAYNELRETKDFSELPRARNDNEVESNMAQYELENAAKCVVIPRPTQFFGPTNVGGGKLDKYTKYLMIPAVKEVTEELANKGQTTLRRLLDLAVKRKIESRKDVQELKILIEDKVKEVYNSENLSELPALAVEITEVLKRYVPDSEFHLDWGEVVPPEIQLPPANASLTEDGFRGEISRKGHGLQRALVFSILQYLQTISEGISEEDKKVGPSLIFAIEEPELYQHPLRCRYLASLFRELSRSEDNQILYTTHSPLFVEIDGYREIRVVRKQQVPDCAKHSTVSSLQFDDLQKRLSECSGIELDNITDSSFQTRISSIMNSILNEGFFADVVFVVEGQGDLGCFWSLQTLLKQDWPSKGISIAAAGGKNNIDRPILIFQGFGIRTFYDFDGDCNCKDDNKKGNIKTNILLQNVGNENPQNFPTTSIYEEFACFNDKLETHIKGELGEEMFDEIAEIVKNELGIQKTKEVLKNELGSSMFVQVAYEKGCRLEFLEAIVEKVTSLASVECIQ